MEDEGSGSGDYEEAEQSEMTTMDSPSTEETETLTDEDENTDEGQSDESVAEPRNFDFGPGEEEGMDDQVVIEAAEKSDEEVPLGIPPSSFWLWNGAPVFNPYVNNAIDREEEPDTAAEPVQQVGKVYHQI